VRVLTAAVVLLLANACSLLVSLDDLGDGGAAPGTLGGPCYANSTCNASLVCALEDGTGVCALADAGLDAIGPDAQTPPADAASEFFAVVGCTPQPDLVAYYTLDETSGTVAHDCVSKTNDGTMVFPGGPADASFAWVDARANSGLRFTAPSGSCVASLSFPTFAPTIGGSQPFTVAMWLLVATAPKIGEIDYIVGKSNNPYQAGWRVSLSPQLTLTLAVPAGDGGVATATSSAIVSTGMYHHVAVTYDPSQTSATIFVDGKGETTSQMPASFALDETDGDTQRLACSSDDQHQSTVTYDEVRFYDRALSAVEVDAVMNAN